MWAQEWQDRLDDLLPYPNTPLVNITRVLEEKQYTIHRMYKTAEQFFTSINLYPMTPKFWAFSMFEKPTDRDVVCHPSAFDMAYHDDYRVKICTVINEDYFFTAHHEMGHVEYYMSYKNQPFYYRDGANKAFHEAIGDTIGMYASKFLIFILKQKTFFPHIYILVSPTHLVKLGFLDEEAVSSQYEINFLMRMALQKIPLLPFAYVVDKYRFALFRNQINIPTELNAKWWQMRLQYGGIMPPVSRHDPKNFDPGAKFHIATNTPYARYLLAHVLQFQFYRAMCRLQGNTKRLHMCDIYGNKYVGEKFRQMLALGCSKLWPEVLETLTGESRLETQAMLDYFEPLYKWLKMENLARGYPIDWT
jgi:peptidyl-dipeptidase A